MSDVSKGKNRINQKGNTSSGFHWGIRKNPIPENLVLDYLLAGNSEFILELKNDKRFMTCRLQRKEIPGHKDYIFCLFVKQNNSDVYAGTIHFQKNDKEFKFNKGQKGKLSEDSFYVSNLLRALNQLYNNDKKLNISVYHTGYCGRCGRTLTDPESILTGLGPICAKIIGKEKIRIMGK